MRVFCLRPGAARLRALSIALSLAILPLPAVSGTMGDIAALCRDRSHEGRQIRDLLEQAGWQQAVVDRDGLYTDLATAMVLEITEGAGNREERLARAPQLAGNFEQMVLSGSARIYARDRALLFFAFRALPEGGEQVTCILGTPSDPETLAMMDAQGGPVADPEAGRILRRVQDDDAHGLRTMQLWSRLTDDPPVTPLPDLYYVERLTPRP